jgi:8-oxo-dGTP pyrophosphatase MutT (NUDIX family)
MRVIKQLTTNKFLNIKEVNDSENNCKGYQFAERRGVDSVAFICYNSGEVSEDINFGKFLVNKEYTPPTNEFHIRAFGGSIDKQKPMIEIVKEEVKEECGYDVSERKIYELGKAFVSTQMNQYCYLYLVDLKGAKMTGRKSENAIEAMAETVWKKADELINGTDWKSIVIINKAKKEGLFL